MARTQAAKSPLPSAVTASAAPGASWSPQRCSFSEQRCRVPLREHGSDSDLEPLRQHQPPHTAGAIFHIDSTATLRVRVHNSEHVKYEYTSVVQVKMRHTLCFLRPPRATWSSAARARGSRHRRVQCSRRSGTASAPASCTQICSQRAARTRRTAN